MTEFRTPASPNAPALQRFLCGLGGAAITGTTVSVDGGLSI